MVFLLAVGSLAMLSLLYARACRALDVTRPLLVSEIMYDPEGPDDKKEWIEIINAGKNGLTVTSTGKNKDIYTFPLRVCVSFDETQDICAKSYPVYYDREVFSLSPLELAVISNDKKSFLEVHPGFTGIVLESKFTLSNKTDGNFVGLYHEDKSVGTVEWLDSVRYYPEWGAKGDGRTLERRDYSTPNTEEDWEASRQLGGTPGEAYHRDETGVVYSDEIRINELVPDPEEGKKETVELFNHDPQGAVSLDGWVIQDKSGKKSKIMDIRIDSGGYILLDNTGVSLNNDGDEIVLLNPEGKIVDSAVYGSSKGKGWSWARKSDGTFEWTSIITLGNENEFPTRIEYPSNILINEFLPNPEGPDKGKEWVELRNFNSSRVNLSGWTLTNSSGMKYNIGGLSLPADGFGVINISNSPFSIGNNDGYLVLSNPDKVEVDSVRFTGSAKEALSYNLGIDNSWRWSRFLSPGKENRFNQLPRIKIKKISDQYKNSPVLFDASKTSDPDSDMLKYSWDFEDGNRSSLPKVQHTYKKKGTYTVQLTVSDGSDEVVKKIKVKVKDHPQRRLEIVRLVPNPAGLDDEGGEVIVIQNKESKRVCLSGYSIASGSARSKLAKHALDDICIGKKQAQTITRQDSAFSLANSFGRVNLLYPDGNIADSVTYGKKKILEDESYIKANGSWRWQVGTSANISATSFESSNEEETSDLGQGQTAAEAKRILPAGYQKEAANNDQEKTAEVMDPIQDINISQRQTVRYFNISDWLPRSEPWLRFLPSFIGNEWKSQ